MLFLSRLMGIIAFFASVESNALPDLSAKCSRQKIVFPEKAAPVHFSKDCKTVYVSPPGLEKLK